MLQVHGWARLMHKKNTSKDRDRRDNNNNSYYLGADGCFEVRYLWSLPLKEFFSSTILCTKFSLFAYFAIKHFLKKKNIFLYIVELCYEVAVEWCHKGKVKESKIVTLIFIWHSF